MSDGLVVVELVSVGIGAGAILMGGIGLGVAVVVGVIIWFASVSWLWFTDMGVAFGIGTGVKVDGVGEGEASGWMATDAGVGWGMIPKSMLNATYTSAPTTIQLRSSKYPKNAICQDFHFDIVPS